MVDGNQDRAGQKTGQEKPPQLIELPLTSGYDLLQHHLLSQKHLTINPTCTLCSKKDQKTERTLLNELL
jgi:hypothetical protein